MKVYVSSKLRHADMWKYQRKHGEFDIISTWIDEDDVEDFPELWERMIQEVIDCDALLAFRALGDEWKGAYVEIGAALATGKPVYLVDYHVGSDTFFHHPLVVKCDNLSDALRRMKCVAL